MDDKQENKWKLEDKIIFGCFVAFSLLWFFMTLNYVEASVLASQTDHAVSNNNAYDIYVQAIASSTAGVPYSVSMYLADSNTREAMEVCIIQSTSTPSGNCTTAGGSAIMLVGSSSSTPSSTKGLNTFIFDSAITLNANTQYWLKLYPYDGTHETTVDAYGTSNGSYYKCFVNNPPTAECVTRSLYYSLEGATVVATTTLTRIVSINSPSNGGVTASTDVTFNFDYYFNSVTDFDVYNNSIIHLRDYTAVQQIITDPQPIIASGGSTYNAVLGLTQGHLYGWEACLAGTGVNGSLLCSNTQTFSVVTASAPQSLLPTGFEEGTTTSTFVNIPTMFINSYPFRLVGDLYDFLISFGSVATTSTSTVATFSSQSNGNMFILATTTIVDYTNSVDHPIFGFLKYTFGAFLTLSVVTAGVFAIAKLL